MEVNENLVPILYQTKQQAIREKNTLAARQNRAKVRKMKEMQQQQLRYRIAFFFIRRIEVF